jgi:small subunit ribosomal protein S14
MARKALIEKSNRVPKFSTRAKNRCKLCGRPRGYMRIFMMCRLCFRKLALDGMMPGVKKTSW